MSDLTALLERVRSATGPNRELDGYIAILLNDPLSSFEILGRRGWAYPEYTASVDAALALVERMLPGADPICLAGEAGRWWASIDTFDGVGEDAEWFRSAPLAILAALLSALIDKAKSPPTNPPRGAVETEAA